MIILRFEPPAPLHFVAGRQQAPKFGLRLRAVRERAGQPKPDQVVEIDFHAVSLLDDVSHFHADARLSENVATLTEADFLLGRYWDVIDVDERELDDDYDGNYLGHVACWNCEEGTVVICMDDLCHGQGYCIHGDGNAVCDVCDGEGWL